MQVKNLASPNLSSLVASPMRNSAFTDSLHFQFSIVTVLVEFYCDRLTDQACVPELLKGLLALSNYDKFTGVDCVKAVKA